MTLGAGPEGSPDNQKVVNWDGPQLGEVNTTNETAQTIGPVSVGRYGYLNLVASSNLFPSLVTVEWSQTKASMPKLPTESRWRRVFVIDQTAVELPAILRIPNLGAWVRVRMAPVGGALYDRLGARVPTCCGMLICITGLGLLYFYLDGSAANLPLVTLALAVFGAGQGLFISPNSSAIMATAPPEQTGQAGSVLNVVRLIGMSAGIAGASTLFALGLGGDRGSTLGVPLSALVAASRDVILLLAGLAAAACMISLIRPRHRAAPHTDAAVT